MSQAWTIPCLVTKNWRVFGLDGARSHAEIAVICGIDENQCLRYGFNLEQKKSVALFDRKLRNVSMRNDEVADWFFRDLFGVPELLIAYVERGHFHENMIPLLTAFPRGECLKIKNNIESKNEESRAFNREVREKVFAIAEYDYDQALTFLQSIHPFVSGINTWGDWIDRHASDAAARYN